MCLVRELGFGYCFAAHHSLRSLANSSRFWFFLATAFSQAGPSYPSNQRLVYLGAASEQRQAGRERKRACSVRPRCLEAELRGRGRA